MFFSNLNREINICMSTILPWLTQINLSDILFLMQCLMWHLFTQKCNCEVTYQCYLKKPASQSQDSVHGKFIYTRLPSLSLWTMLCRLVHRHGVTVPCGISTLWCTLTFAFIMQGGIATPKSVVVTDRHTTKYVIDFLHFEHSSD